MKTAAYFLVALSILSLSDIAFSGDKENYIDTSLMKEGQLVIVEFDQELMCIHQRSPEQISWLNSLHKSSGKSTEGTLRSQKERFFVFKCASPASGCGLSYFKPAVAPQKYANVRRYGGFLDKCTGQEYDFSGRPFGKGKPLTVPNHYFSGTRVIFPSGSNNSFKADSQPLRGRERP